MYQLQSYPWLWRASHINYFVLYQTILAINNLRDSHDYHGLFVSCISTELWFLAALLWTIPYVYLWTLWRTSRFFAADLPRATPHGFRSWRPLTGDLLPQMLAVLLGFTTPAIKIFNWIRPCKIKETGHRQKKQQQYDICKTIYKN